MGTQQILLIVLSVIIVGAAIAVGITMFNNQSYSSNKAAIAADAQNFASQVVQYYKTPASQGGGDRSIPPTGTDGAKTIASFIGWGDTATYKNDNGWYTLEVKTAGADGEVTITGNGREKNGGKVPKIETTIKFPAGEITATASDNGNQGT
jgi:hypothetical protein